MSIEHKTEGPWRCDVTDDMSEWASNALRFDSEDDALAYGSELSGRWMGVKAYRAVPSDHAQREPVDTAADVAAGRKVVVW